MDNSGIHKLVITDLPAGIYEAFYKKVVSHKNAVGSSYTNDTLSPHHNRVWTITVNELYNSDPDKTLHDMLDIGSNPICIKGVCSEGMILFTQLKCNKCDKTGKPINNYMFSFMDMLHVE